MATFVSIPAYRKELQRKIKELKKDQTRSPAKAASYMVLQAKRRAPRYSGQTIQGIRRKKSGKSYTVESWVPGTFKQNLWANQTSPFRTLHYRKGNFRFGIKKGTRAIYGKTPSHFNWSGTPRFFHIATNMTRRKFGEIARKNTQKSLRGGIS